MKPRLLDLFCGDGGAGAGYAVAGFEVVGVDRARPRRYPFKRIRADALDVLADICDGTGWTAAVGRIDAIHASPPCQRYSFAAKLNPGTAERHPDLIAPVRELLIATGLPYVIENVEGARGEMRHPTLLCGSMFGLHIRRHRLFEASFPVLAPACQHGVEATYPRQYVTTTKRDGKKHLAGIVNAAATGARFNIEALKAAMEVPWMVERQGITEAIPPAYTELIGSQLLHYIGLEDRREKVAPGM